MRWTPVVQTLMLSACLGGQSGDSDVIGTGCELQRLELDDPAPFVSFTVREFVERYADSSAPAFEFAPEAVEPLGGFEPLAARWNGRVTLTLVADEERPAFACSSRLDAPVVVTLTQEGGFTQSFDAVLSGDVSEIECQIAGLQPAGTSSALELASAESRHVAGSVTSASEAAPLPLTVSWSSLPDGREPGQCLETFRGNLQDAERWLRWPVACGGLSQGPLDTPGLHAPALYPTLASPDERELYDEGFPPLSVTTSTSDPSHCASWTDDMFDGLITVESAGVSATAQALFYATTDPQGRLSFSGHPELCLDVSSSPEWATLAARQGAMPELCLGGFFYSVDEAGALRLGVEAWLMGSAVGFDYH